MKKIWVTVCEPSNYDEYAFVTGVFSNKSDAMDYAARELYFQDDVQEWFLDKPDEDYKIIK